MINWFNMPDEGLSNGGLFEVKELEVTENGTYEEKGEMYNKVTVNVSGGGSSDFSTAEVTIINNTNDEMFIYVAILQTDPEDTSYGCVYLDTEEQATVTVILYKGKALTNIPFFGTATSTNGNYDDGTITGNDTITINPAP